jgi:putative lipoprotein
MINDERPMFNFQLKSNNSSLPGTSTLSVEHWTLNICLLSFVAAVLLPCLAAAAAEPPATPFATVTGTVECKDTTKFGSDTSVEISILDVTKADAPAITLGKQVFRDFKSFPFAFEVPYVPSAVKPGHRYILSVRILVSSRLSYITDTAIPILGDNPAKDIKVPVVKVKPPEIKK